jgi:hypothetical protein
MVTVKQTRACNFGHNHEAKISSVIEDVTDINISEIVVSNNLLITTDRYDINKLKIHTDSANLVDTVIKIDYFQWSIFSHSKRKNKATEHHRATQ